MSEGVVLALGPRLHVSVDFWRRAWLPVAGHFLTHMHADHTEGLGNDWRSAGGSTIYCSPATQRLLQEKWPELAGPIVALPVGETALLRLAPPGGGDAMDVSVTPLDACHCLGAVMFLFEGPFGRILHTGDFRWELEAQDALEWPSVLRYAPIDLLLLDNTYCHPRFEAPTRAQAAAAVLQLVRAHPRHDIVIGVDSLGKEELLAEVAAALAPHEQLGVAPGRAGALWVAGHDPALFTPHVSDVRVRVVPRWQLTLERLAKLNRAAPTLGIIASGFRASDAASVREPTAVEDKSPSRQALKVEAALSRLRRSSGGGSGGVASGDMAMGSGNSSSGGRLDLSAYAALLASVAVPDPSDSAPATLEETQAARQLLHHVPYSLHCTFGELATFVGRLRPRAVRGIVKGSARSGYPTGGSAQAVSVADALAAAANHRRAAAGGSTGGRALHSCLDPAVHFAHLLRADSGGDGGVAEQTSTPCGDGSGRTLAGAGAPSVVCGSARLRGWQGLLRRAATPHQRLAAAGLAAASTRRHERRPVPSAAGRADCHAESGGRLADGDSALSSSAADDGGPGSGNAAGEDRGRQPLDGQHGGGRCGSSNAGPTGDGTLQSTTATAGQSHNAKRPAASRTEPAVSKRRLPARFMQVNPAVRPLEVIAANLNMPTVVT